LRQSAQEILHLIETQAPQMVIAVDEAAQIYLVEPFLKGRSSPQVIFCGVNAPISLYGFPASNVSGVRERCHFREGFALLKKLSPNLRSVAVLSDNSESSGYVLENLSEDQKKLGAFALKLAGVEKVDTFQDWQRMVMAYQNRADALAIGIFHSLVDESTGQVVPPAKVIAWTHTVNKKPTLGFSDYVRAQGILCGVLESGHEQGYLAGAMARSVLTKGVRAGSLAVRINQKGIVFLNLKAAERFGLSIPYELIEAAEVVLE
ncbi:MAG: ABC transporter substrate binding protein, partial [Humidesulfovibrio sp.]|nr:ABC transporter substrate binding protein [Humidesulfovibrio sp.]